MQFCARQIRGEADAMARKPVRVRHAFLRLMFQPFPPPPLVVEGRGCPEARTPEVEFPYPRSVQLT